MKDRVLANERQDLGEDEHPHKSANDHADHVGHEEYGTKSHLAPAPRFNQDRQEQGNHVLEYHHEDYILEGKQNRFQKIGVLRQSFDIIGESHHFVGGIQTIPIR